MVIMTMVSQKVFYIFFFSQQPKKFSFFMELKNLCVFAFALVMIVNLRIFNFLRPTENLLIFFSSFYSGNIFLSLQARKLKAKSKASVRFNDEINLLIFIAFCCGPDTREKKIDSEKVLKTNSQERNDFNSLCFYYDGS